MVAGRCKLSGCPACPPCLDVGVAGTAVGWVAWPCVGGGERGHVPVAGSLETSDLVEPGQGSESLPEEDPAGRGSRCRTCWVLRMTPRGCRKSQVAAHLT